MNRIVSWLHEVHLSVNLNSPAHIDQTPKCLTCGVRTDQLDDRTLGCSSCIPMSALLRSPRRMNK